MGWRSIVVDGRQYRWRGASYVVVQDKDGNRVCAGNAPEIKGISWSDWERGGWKSTPDGMMRPGEVAAFIRLSLALPRQDGPSVTKERNDAT